MGKKWIILFFTIFIFLFFCCLFLTIYFVNIEEFYEIKTSFLKQLNILKVRGEDFFYDLDYEYEYRFSLLKNFLGLEKSEDIICKDCNIILVSIDTLRSDHLPCLGYYKNTAPYMCKIAQRSLLFENFIVHGYLTPISQMSIFTSEYPSTNGIISFFSKLNCSTKTLAQLLKQNGYTNAAFGSSPEFMAKFDMNENKSTVNLFDSFSKGFDVFKNTGYRDIPLKESLEWINKNKNKKFFLWIPIGAVHFPYGHNVPSELMRMFEPKGYEGILKKDSGIGYDTLSRIFMDKYYYNHTQPAKILRDIDKEYIISKYDAGIFYVDTYYVRELLRTVKKAGIEDNTIIVFHGIHGEDLGEHGYFSHYDIYDTEVKNFLILYNPKKIMKDKKIKIQVRGIDIVPTLLDLVGISSPSNMKGQSLTNLTTNSPLFIPEEVYIERRPLWEEILFLARENWGFGIPSDYTALLKNFFNDSRSLNRYKDTAIRTNEWKLIHRKSRMILAKIGWWNFLSNKTLDIEPYELYNLKEDPLEQNNVVDLYPEVVRDLKTKLLLWEKEYSD